VTDNGAAIVKVLEKKTVTDEELAKGRPELKEEMLSTERDRFYLNYMDKVRERTRERIQINAETLAQLLG
jgi:hypothetical protein